MLQKSTLKTKDIGASGCNRFTNSLCSSYRYHTCSEYAVVYNYFQDKPSNGLFVPRCFFHVLAKNDKAWSGIEVPVVGSDDTILLKDIISNWLTGAGPFQAIDNPSETNQFCSGETMA